MAKRPRGHSISLLRETATPSDAPLHRLLYDRIRTGVLRGSIPPGTRLPAARTLAREEGVSRNTVEAALRRLKAEGFVTRRVGAGTWISDQIPARLLGGRSTRGASVRRAIRGETAPGGVRRGERPRRVAPASDPNLLSLRGTRFSDAEAEPVEPPDHLFAPSAAGLDDLPLRAWNRIARRQIRGSARRLLVPVPPEGMTPLREAIAAYLHMNRGVRCSPDQVLVVNSTQQGIDLAARLLLDPGDAVWLEDPGYLAARRAFVAAGARGVPVPVDEEGIDVRSGTTRAPDARVAYVTPSHQYPLGVTMSLTRRLELLEWASNAKSWIIEDDYDGELRYDGHPLAAVQGINASGRVIYAGTFNKILFPAVRAAYLVLPQPLVEPFVRAKALTDGFTAPFVQALLADFLGEGHFAAHLRTVRDLYRARRDHFLHAVGPHLPSGARLGPADAGVHVALHLAEGTDDRSISRRALRLGLALPALSHQAVESSARGLLVHYGYVSTTVMDAATSLLGRVLSGGD